MSDENQDKQAQYNSAQYAIDRVHTLKQDIHYAKLTKNFGVWCDLLFNYLSEVNPQMTEEQEKEYLERLENVKRRVNRPTRGLQDIYKQRIYNELYKVELQLERFFDSKGNKFLYNERQREIEGDDQAVKEILRQNQQRQEMLSDAISKLGINQEEAINGEEQEPGEEQE